MMTLSGFVLDGMTRGIGWRFLSMGRRVERLATMCTALQVAIEDGRGHGLDWLLDLADSTVTYRSRYLVAPEWLPVLDLLVRDDANPRSLAFQVEGPGGVHRQARGEPWPLRGRRAGARRMRRCAPCSRPTCIPRASCCCRLLEQLQRAALRGVGRALDEVLLARGVAQRAVAGGLSLPMDIERYRVEHETRYAYPRRCRSRGSSRASRRARCRGSTLVAHELQIDPATDERHDERDSFGNARHPLRGLHGAHRCCACACAAGRDRRAARPGRRRSRSPGKRCATRCAREPAQDDLAPARMSEPTRAGAAVGSGARLCGAVASRPAATGSRRSSDLMHRIHADFEFEPGATTVSTSVDEVLHQRSGVCQDFAHLMLACLRGHGLPARYVSGYLLHRAAAGAAAADGRRRLACLGRGLVAAPRLGRVRSDQRPRAPTSATSPSPGAPTSPTSCRCAA